MKQLLTVILLIVVLGATVSGCGGSHRYDSRLTAADSLMRSNPDSALAIVEGIARDSLTREGDRAYRDLLLTQARYRCYITATSDSDINRALCYYRAHSGEREKLTRAYIYKGAVMEELGHPDSAMLYYKTAEATAAPDNYFNLGQINIRIASLYRNFYADFHKCYEKYSNALKYYEYLGDKRMQQRCTFNMGICAGITHTENPKKLLERALVMATELKDSAAQYECKESMCCLLSRNDSSLHDSKALALDCLNKYKRFVNEDLLLDIAYIYTREHKFDSAMHFIGLVDEQQCLDSNRREQIQYRKNEILSSIAEHNGDMSLYKTANDSAIHVTEQIYNSKTRYVIQSIESQQERKLTQKKDKDNNTLKVIIWGSLAVFVLILMILTHFFLRKLNRTEALIKEIQENGVNAHKDLIKQISGKDSEIAHFITSLVELLRMALQTKTVSQKLSLDSQLKSLVSQTTNDDFWHELLVHIDNSYNKIISRLSQNPRIKKSDLRFIGLACCGFSYAEIAFIMDYSPKYISNKRKSIAKKLGLNEPLLSYLEQETGSTLDSGDYQKQ